MFTLYLIVSFFAVIGIYATYKAIVAGYEEYLLTKAIRDRREEALIRRIDVLEALHHGKKFTLKLEKGRRYIELDVVSRENIMRVEINGKALQVRDSHSVFTAQFQGCPTHYEYDKVWIYKEGRNDYVPGLIFNVTADQDYEVTMYYKQDYWD